MLINFCLSGELAHHTYATVAQVVRASASYSEGQWFKSTLWHHKQKFDFSKNFCYNIYVKKIKKYISNNVRTVLPTLCVRRLDALLLWISRGGAVRLARQTHYLEVAGSNPARGTKDFNILLLFLSVYKDPQSEILDGRVVAKLWVNIGSNIFWKCIRNKKTFQHHLFTSKPFGLFFLDVVNYLSFIER